MSSQYRTVSPVQCGLPSKRSRQHPEGWKGVPDVYACRLGLSGNSATRTGNSVTRAHQGGVSVGHIRRFTRHAISGRGITRITRRTCRPPRRGEGGKGLPGRWWAQATPVDHPLHTSAWSFYGTATRLPVFAMIEPAGARGGGAWAA